MQVIEAAAQPKPSQPPSAELVGLQFGLATAKDFLRFSVLESRCKDSLNNLVDPRLGLPAENEICATCGGTNYDECAGHFAHVKLTQPIFHPNHMRLVQRILQKICLACGIPKVKKKDITFSEEAGNWKQSSRDFFPEEVNGDREHPLILEAEPIEKYADDNVIDLSSSDDEISGILRVAVPHGPLDFTIGSTSQSAIMPLPRLGSNKSKGKAHANGSSHLEVTTNGTKKSAIGTKKSASFKSQFTESPVKSPVKNSVKIYKGRPAGLDVLDADTLQTAKSSTTSTCLHCSPGYPDYRPILVKILPVKGRKKDDSSEILLLEVQVSKTEEDVWLPDDFWAFLEGPAHPKDNESKVPKKHVLSPSEALTILKKIPERAIGKLGMNRLVARPEGLVMKCVPIPPNCTRTTDYKYVNNTTAVRFGSDNVTRTLQNLVTEIGRIHRTRTGKAMNRAQRDESTALQILTAEYLREKGAPKAVPGKEPLKKDRNGRITKQDDHRWTKEWLSQNVLAKGGNFTARAVIAGDPSLGIEEIGVPWAIAQKLTLPERATWWNCTKLQEYVDRSQAPGAGSGKPGATRIERSGQAFQVLEKSTHKVQIGDVIHRNIQNGDYVYVNRPPSVHKHSLMALKVHVHGGLVITVNPLVCPPFSADFDGDIFHIFIPQSLQAIAELEQLMAVPQQIVSDHGGQPLLGLTQDTLLAAHLLTTRKLFVDKASMDQLCLWSSKQPPEAAILKSPKGGPFWTGEQVFGLTLPAKLNMGSPDESILIQGGQITKWIDGTKLLRKDNESIASALCLQLGPLALVDYLNNATGLLHAWLQVQGFSTGLTDFQVTNNSAARKKMLQSIFEEYYLKSIQESCDSVRILDAKVQAMGPDMNPDSLTKNVRFLEQAAQQIFRTRESDAENIVVKYAEEDNSLLLMVKSGSKGSRGKLLQQIAGMGLQLYKGKHLLPFPGLRRPSMSDDPVLDWWKDKGLVRSSLVDGLNAPELFNHVIADRTGILRKHVEVAQPGTLFKSLMLFLRDLHVMYDGSVRSQCGKNLVQFCYGGAKGVPRRTVSKTGSIRNQFGMDYPMIPVEEAEGDLTWEEDDRKRWPLSHLAGEPVGVLAATAISQPAYEVMLDAPNLNGPFNPRPLELVQETLYPREKSDLKPIDRCVIIRLGSCLCTKPFCLEKRVLAVQAYLTRITLKTLAQSSAIQFWNMEDFRLAGPSGEALRLGSPWLGHIKLSLDMMQQHKVDVEDIVQRLCDKFSASIKNPKKHPMGQIFFCSSLDCSISNGCCLHFSPRLPKKIQNEQDDDIYNEALLTLLMKIRATIIPGLLDCTVKGDERLESVRIVSEGPIRTTWHNELAYNRDLDEELVLEIVVSPTKSKSKRSMAWASVKQACLPLMDMVDWNRSMPYSIQEIRHALGIEAAYEMVTKRLRLVLEKTAPHTHHEHEMLIADMMTSSGDANGFTFSGFQDMNKSTAVSAPFTEASFQKPIRTLLDAAGRGATDSVEGVMTNCVWGKEAPLGTGSSFDLFWQPSKDLRRVATSREAERDVHAIWKDLDEKCIPDKIIPLSPTHSLPGLHILPEGDPDLDDGAGFSPQHAPSGNDADDIWGSSHQKNNGDDGTWGNSPVAREDDGGWGGVGKAGDGNDPGGWDQDELSSDGIKGQGEPEEQGAWGSVSKEKGMSGDTWDDKSKEDTQGGWGGGAAETGNQGGWGDEGDGSDEGRLRPSGDDRNDGVKSKQVNIQSGQKSSKDLGGWESSNQGGRWDDVNSTVPDQGSWDSVPSDVAGLECSGNLKPSNKGHLTVESKGTRSGAGNSSSWGADPVQESGVGGWGSVSTEVAEGDGWDSLAESQTESARHSGSEHTDHNGGRGRGRGGYEKDWGSTRSTSVSGANVIPLGVRRQFGKFQADPKIALDSGLSQEQNVGEESPWDDSLSHPQYKTARSSGWDRVPTSTKTPTGRDGNYPGEPYTDCPNALLQSSDEDPTTDSGVDWGELISGTTKIDAWATNNWASFAISQSNIDSAADGWDTVLPENQVAGIRARATHSSVGAMSHTLRQQETEPECKEIDDLVKSMRRILFNNKYEIGGRLSDKDDEAVQAVLAYHPKFNEKAGCGVAYIKVDRSQDYSDSNCFWLVRTDGSEIEFSYHKCLKEKVSREFPSFALDWYDNLYKNRRSLAPPANLAEEGKPADQREDRITEVDQESAPMIVVDISSESICKDLTESIHLQH